MKEKTQGERRVEKDKGLVYEVSWRASPQKLTKKKTGMSPVAGKGMRFTEREMRVEDEKEIEGGERRKKAKSLHA